jgi:hypothetical protein
MTSVPVSRTQPTLRTFLVNSRTRLFILAALTSLVPLGAGVYSLDPAVSEPSSDGRAAAPFQPGPMTTPAAGPDALVHPSLPAGDLFGRAWTPRSTPREAPVSSESADRSGGSAVPGSPPDSADGGDVVGAVPRKGQKPDRWEVREA